MSLQFSKSMTKRGIALFGGNFVLPFENQTHLSNSLSIQYLQFCQKYNSTQLSKITQESNKQQTISTIKPAFTLNSNTSSKKSNSLLSPRYYDFLVLASRKNQDMHQVNEREFYDIGTIVTLEKCPETGAIKALSKGVDSLVRIKKSAFSTDNKYAPQYTSCNRLIIENEPTALCNSVLKTSDFAYVVHDQRKLFFCDYEPLHDKVPKYSDKEKEHFIKSIYDLAQKTNLQNFSQKAFLENLAADSKNNMFPRLQLFQLLKHFDSKYYFNRRNSQWLDQKYEILKTKNDEQILQTLDFVSRKLSV